MVIVTILSITIMTSLYRVIQVTDISITALYEIHKVIAFLLVNFPRYCPLVVHATGFHRYKPRFLCIYYFIDDYTCLLL